MKNVKLAFWGSSGARASHSRKLTFRGNSLPASDSVLTSTVCWQTGGLAYNSKYLRSSNASLSRGARHT
jgi:hypothetical protein